MNKFELTKAELEIVLAGLKLSAEVYRRNDRHFDCETVNALIHSLELQKAYYAAEGEIIAP